MPRKQSDESKTKSIFHNDSFQEGMRLLMVGLSDEAFTEMASAVQRTGLQTLVEQQLTPEQGDLACWPQVILEECARRRQQRAAR